MKRLLVIYDWLSEHSRLMKGTLFLLVALLCLLVSRLDVSEDISDFLPLGSDEREALSVYQGISGADGLYILFDNPGDADLTVRAMDSFSEKVHAADSLYWCSDLTTMLDMDSIGEVMRFCLDNAPYFLSNDDYSRMDSLMAVPGYVADKVRDDMDMLIFPSGDFVADNLSRDPLGLFSGMMRSLQSSNRDNLFEIYDGHIFTGDFSRAVAMMSSPFGASETRQNARLMDLLEGAIDKMNEEFPEISAHVVGGPAIAVGNSSRIRTDSITAICISAVLIILLLFYSFHSLRNILMTLLSISWGWLFAVGMMSLFAGKVSLIVIGISSVILGIAVNYPLHLIAHSADGHSMRDTLKDIAAPLVIGNVTTVGAFAALVPLNSTALRDLGLFASLLLVGTIVFVLVFLPHMAKPSPTSRGGGSLSTLTRVMARFNPDRNKYFVAAVILVTAVMAYFSLGTEFDTNMANINYMSSQQKEDMKYFSDLFSKDDDHTAKTLYAMSSGMDFQEALSNALVTDRVIDSLEKKGIVVGRSGVGTFLCPENEQVRRISLWRDFVGRHKDALTTGLAAAASQCGFSDDAFADFDRLVSSCGQLQAHPFEYFSPLTESVFARNVTSLQEYGRSYIVDAVEVEPENLNTLKAALPSCFDVESTNGALAQGLSDDFNYIGWACSLIVFFFLWFSFGSFELALISFLPMAVSWIWILGIMTVLGIKFNIVNVILATFIFGQGDDYTIFMTEGCQSEYASGRAVLPSYKSSILQSALIMFAGIGTLIVAKHPAMRSLSEVTIIGMFSVVLMAYLIPPLLFRFMTMKNGRVRRHPLSLSLLWHNPEKDPVRSVMGRYMYKGSLLYRQVRRSLSCGAAAIDSRYRADGGVIAMEDDGFGQTALLLALLHPDTEIVARMRDEQRLAIAKIAAEDFVENVEFIL